MALYAAHLPLDAHPQLGQNVQIAQALELGQTEPFAALSRKSNRRAGKSDSERPPERTWKPVLTEKIGSGQAFFTFGPTTDSNRRHCRRLSHRAEPVPRTARPGH